MSWEWTNIFNINWLGLSLGGARSLPIGVSVAAYFFGDGDDKRNGDVNLRRKAAREG